MVTHRLFFCVFFRHFPGAFRTAGINPHLNVSVFTKGEVIQELDLKILVTIGKAWNYSAPKHQDTKRYTRLWQGLPNKVDIGGFRICPPKRSFPRRETLRRICILNVFITKFPRIPIDKGFANRQFRTNQLDSLFDLIEHLFRSILICVKNYHQSIPF